MEQRLLPHGTVRHNEFVLKFWRDPYELTLFPDGRAIIKGTTDTGVAAQPLRQVRRILNAKKAKLVLRTGSGYLA